MSNQRRDIAGRSLRWDENRAKAAYSQGFWVRETLAEALAQASLADPERVLIIDGEVRLTAHSLHSQASTLAQVMAARFPSARLIDNVVLGG